MSKLQSIVFSCFLFILLVGLFVLERMYPTGGLALIEGLLK